MLPRFLAELRRFSLIALFLFFFFAAFATYRRLILSEYRIDYFQYGYSFLEALVLAKVIMLGDLFHLGDRFHGKPLIIPTLYRTLTFSLLVLVFTLLEHFAKGFIHGENMATVFAEIAAQGAAQIAAKILVMFIAFVPMFAIWEIGSVFGESKLFDLFFKRSSKVEAGVSGVTDAASLRQS